jgi:hypothetical protein
MGGVFGGKEIRKGCEGERDRRGGGGLGVKGDRMIYET